MRLLSIIAACTILSWQIHTGQQPSYLVGEWRIANFFPYDTSNTVCGFSKYNGIQFTNTKNIYDRRIFRANGTGEFYKTYVTNGHMDELPIRNPAKYIRYSFTWKQSGDTLIRHIIEPAKRVIKFQLDNRLFAQSSTGNKDEKYLVIAHGNDYLILDNINNKSFSSRKSLTVWVKSNVQRGQSILRDEYYILPYVKKLVAKIPNGKIYSCEDSLNFIKNTKWVREHY